MIVSVSEWWRSSDCLPIPPISSRIQRLQKQFPLRPLNQLWVEVSILIFASDIQYIQLLANHLLIQLDIKPKKCFRRTSFSANQRKILLLKFFFERGCLESNKLKMQFNFSNICWTEFFNNIHYLQSSRWSQPAGVQESSLLHPFITRPHSTTIQSCRH